MKGKSSKGQWFIIAVATLLVAAILILGNQSFKATEKATFDEFNQRQLVMAREAAGGIELYFENLASDMRALARVAEIQHLDEAPTRREIQRMFDELEPWGVNDIGVLDADGVLRYNVKAPEIEGTDFSWRRYYQEAKEMTSSDSYIAQFIEFKGVEAGQKGVLVAVPVFELAADTEHPDPSGHFAGVVLCTLRLDTITQKFVVPLQSSERGHALLVGDAYDVLWSPDESHFGKNLLEEGAGFPLLQEILERMSAGESGTAEYSYYEFEDSVGEYTKDREQHKLIAYTPIHLGNKLWAIGVWAPKEDARQLIRFAYQRQLLVIGAGILTILIGAIYALVTSFRTTRLLEREVEAKVGELKESEDRYRRLVELSPDAIAVQSEDQIVFVNRAGAELFGAEESEQILGKSVWDFVLPENRTIVAERYRQMRERGVRVPHVEQRFVRLDGTHVDVEVTAAPLEYKGKPAIQAIFHDITQRKKAEEALQAAHAFQQSILDGVAEPIVVVDPGYQIRMMNRAAREFSFEEADLAEPTFCYQLSHQGEAPCKGMQHPCPMEQVRESGQPVTVIHEHYQANGERRLVEVIAAPLWGADGAFQGIIESTRDITERQWAESALEQQVQASSYSEDELGQFASKVVESLQNFFGKLPSD